MHRRPLVVRAVAETLEQRRLLADLITIWRDGSGVMWINRNGIPLPMTDNTVNGSAGNDTIRVESTGANALFISPGAGADTVIVATNGDLDDLGAGGVFVFDGTDSVQDSLDIGDYADGGNDTYDFSQVAVSGRTKLIKPDIAGNESEFVEWDPTRYTVTLKTNSGNSTVTLPNTFTMDSVGESITIDDSIGNGGSFVEFRSRLEDPAAFSAVGGSGNDTLDFFEMGANYGFVDFSFDAGAGTDTLLVRGQADTVTIDASDALIDNTTESVTFDWTNLEAMEIYATGGVVFNVTGAVGTEPNTTLRGSTSTDTFNIGSGNIANVNNAITVDGDTGLDNLIINDSTSSGSKNHSFDSGVYSYAGGHSVTLIDTEYVTIIAGTGNDTVTVGTALAGIGRIEVNGGVGNDTVNVTPHETADLILNGGSPAAAPGDVLSITRAGATNGRLVANGIGTDIVFDDRETIYFSSFETAPTSAAAPAAPDLLTADDTGLSSTDNHTNDTTARFSGNVGAGNATVRLFRSGVEIGSGLSDIAGDYIVTGTFPVGDNTSPITVTFQGLFSVVRSNISSATNIRVDTVAPAAPTAAPDMLFTSDSGVEDDDNWTNDNTPTFATTSAERVRLLEGANVLIDYALPGNLTVAALTDGNYTITSRNIDVAGNASPLSPSLVMGIDTVAPGAPAAPDLLAVNDMGLSDTDDITSDNAPSFSVNTTGSAPYVRLFVDGVLSSGNFEDKNSAQAIGLNDGVRAISARGVDAAGNVSATGPALNITVDTVLPQLTVTPAFLYNAEFTQPHALTYFFNEDVSGSLAPADFVITNTTTGATYSPTLAYNAGLGRALLRFPTITSLGIAGMLPDGNYSMAFTRTNILDIAGNPMQTNSNRTFFALMGDANHDRIVGFDDLLIVAQSYNTTGRSFSQGNLNYDPAGQVGFDDLLLLAQRYGVSLGMSGTTATIRHRSKFSDVLG